MPERIRAPLAAKIPKALLVVATMNGVVPAPVNAQTSEVLSSRDAATFQLALTMKMRADEQYLAGDTSNAKPLYEQAQSELRAVGTDWRTHNPALASMLETDIDYRLTLLKYDADFWGASYSLTPINPVEAYVRFTDTVEKFADVVADMQKWQNENKGKAVTAAQLEAARSVARTDFDTQALKGVMADIQAKSHAASATAARERIDRNLQRQKEIANERERLNAQYDAAHKQFDTLAVNGVLKAAGLPPELSGLANGASLQDTLLKLGESYILSEGGVSDAFKEYSKATAEFVDAAQKIHEAAKDVKQLSDTAEAVTTAVRRGSLEGVLQVGTVVYQQLPKAEQDRLAQWVLNDNKPLLALIDTAQRMRPTLDAVSILVSNDPKMVARLKEVLKQEALNNVSAFDTWYRARLAGASQLKVDAALLAEQALRAWPKAFIAQLPADVRQAWSDALGGISDTQLAAKLVSHWPPAEIRILAAERSIEVSVNGKTARIDIQAFVHAQSKFSLESIADYPEIAVKQGTDAARKTIQTQTAQLVDGISSNAGAFTRELTTALPALSLSVSLDRVLTGDAPSPDSSDKLFDDIWERMPAAARPAATEQLASMQAGSVIARQVMAADRRRPARMSSNDDRGGSATAATEEAILRMAVTAAFPAAGAALMAADGLKALGRMDDLANRINALTREDRSIMAEQFALYDLVRDERVALALSDVSKRVADRRMQGAEEQIEHYNRATQQLNMQGQRDLYMQRLFMPRAFWLSEQLRLHFDQLDRSIAFWTGDPRRTRGQIATELTRDPQMLRYALDPSINVYTWLNRGNEGDRSDLSTMVEEWKRKKELATRVCLKLSCLEKKPVMGSVTKSPELTLKELLPDQWKRYEDWAKGVEPGDFSFEFLMTPAILLPAKGIHIIRLVDVRAGIETKSGMMVASDSSVLSHPGAAFIPYGDSYFKEHYVPKQIINPGWEPFVVSELSSRWSQNYDLRRLEGYGAYTLWRYTLGNTAMNRNAVNVTLQFFYQYQDKHSPRSDWELQNETARAAAWRLTYRTADQRALRLRLTDMPFFGGEEESRRAIARIQADPEAKQLGLASAVLEEEKQP